MFKNMPRAITISLESLLDRVFEESLASDLVSARQKLRVFVEDYKRREPDCDMTAFSKLVVEMLCNKLDRVSCVAYPRWANCAREQLCEEVERVGSVDVSNDEIIYQMLGAMGKCFVFGVYHGNIIHLPRSIALKIIARRSCADALRWLKEGLSPLVLELHLPHLHKKRMTEQLNIDAHLKIAEFMEEFTDVRGLYGASWYYDPCVKDISPHLAFFHDFSVSNGASIFNVGSDAAAITDAVCSSEKRRRLYEGGEYLPKRYARFWRSESIVQWAAKVGN